MKKLGIFGRFVVLFAGIGIVIAIPIAAETEANQPRTTVTTATSESGERIPTGTTVNTGKRGGLDPELLEYFESAEDMEENEASPRSHPVFFIKNSIWKNSNDKKIIGAPSSNASLEASLEPKGGLLPRIFRRLSDGIDDNKGAIDDYDRNPFGYSNYQKEEVEDHEEELITDDDNDNDDWDMKEDMMLDNDPRTSVPTTGLPSPLPTSLGSSFWDGLDAYERPVDTAKADIANGSMFADPEMSKDGGFPAPAAEISNPNSIESGWKGDDNEDNDENEDITDTDILLSQPDNSIVLRLSFGVVNLNLMTHDDHMDIVGMALRTNTLVLNQHSDLPFEVFDHLIKFRDGDDRRGRDRKRKLGDDEDEYLAKIILEHIVIERGDFDWWAMSAIYSVWKNPQIQLKSKYQDYTNGEDKDKDRWRRALQLQEVDAKNQEEEEDQRQRCQDSFCPVKSRTILKRIEAICADAIENSLQNDVYWKTLGSIDFGNHDLLLDQNQKLFYGDDMGIADVKAVGDEYNLDVCPMDRPQYGAGLECTMPLVGSNDYRNENYRVDDGPTISIDVNDYCEECTNPEAIAESIFDIEWGAREWVGFALMVSTLVSVVILSVAAHLVSQKRQKQVMWGAALTPTGVDDILQVGWRVYEQPQGQPPIPSQVPGNLRDLKQQQQQQLQQQQLQQQLFLQIYDKGHGQGYNDDNSLLRGGVEQQLFAPPVAPLPTTS